MDISFTFKQLGEKVKEVYINQQKYQLVRDLKEFTSNGKYIGDYLNYIIFEEVENQSPLFYLIGGPFDIISHKAPQQALVFQNGELLLNIPYTHYADVRTGLMDSLIASSLGATSMKDKKILYLGTGGVAKESLKSLKEFFPEISEVSFINKTDNPKEFGALASQLSIMLKKSSLEEIGEYDYIFGHTNAENPVLLPEHIEKIKTGAFITTFSGPGIEIANEFFNSEHANVLTDWKESFTATKNLESSIASNILDKNKVIFLKDVFSGDTKINPHAKYTIYRSTGTPMQNIAVLKLLLNK